MSRWHLRFFWNESKHLLTLRPFSFSLVFWLLGLGIWSFLIKPFFEAEEATLRGVLAIAPWLLSSIVPILAALVWHPKLRPGYEEWLQATGLPAWKRISLQTLALMLTSLSLILASLPLAISLQWLGPLDRGLWLSHYLGLWLYACFALSLTGFLIRFTKRPWTAITLSIAVLFSLLSLHHHALADRLARILPGHPVAFFLELSPLAAIESLSLGILDNKALAQLVGSSFFFWLGHILLQKKQRTLTLRGTDTPHFRFWLLLDLWLLGGFACLAIHQSHVFRYDLSEDKIFSLSEGTRSLLKNLDRPIAITFYYSYSLPGQQEELRLHGRRVAEIFAAMALSAPHRIDFQQIDPSPDSAFEVEARWDGMRPKSLRFGDFYLGARFQLDDKKLIIPFFEPEEEAQLEYDIAETIVKLSQTRKPILGVMSSLPVLNDRDDDGPRLRQDWAFIQALRSFYDIEKVGMKSEIIPTHISTLLVVHPKNISELSEYAIDQFVVRGGHLIIVVDPFCESELAYISPATQGTSLNLSSDLPILFKSWGIQYDRMKMVGDLARSAKQLSLQKVVHNPFHIELSNKDLNRNHPVTRTLRRLLMVEPGNLRFIGQGRSWESLVQSSDKSGILSTDYASYMSPSQLAQELKPDGEVRSLSGILSGHWVSAFSEKPLGSPIPEHLALSTESNAVIIISDSDFLADSHAVEKLQIMSELLVRPRNDNTSFLMHAVEYLGGNRDLIAIAGGASLHRPLSHWQNFVQTMREPWLDKEERITSKILEMEAQIKDIEAQGEQSAALLSTEQLATLKRLRESETGLWTERRRLRQKSRFLPDLVQSSYAFAHILLLPSLAGLWVLHQRRSDRKTKKRLLDKLFFSSCAEPPRK